MCRSGGQEVSNSIFFLVPPPEECVPLRISSRGLCLVVLLYFGDLFQFFRWSPVDCPGHKAGILLPTVPI